ncbi:MAG: preprotein translocase subunit SecG [Vampirovibrionales bacterium]
MPKSPSFFFYLVVVLQMLSGALGLLLILLHSPKSDGLGGGLTQGVSQLFQNQKGAEALLNRTTAIVMGVFFVCSFLLGYMLVR